MADDQMRAQTRTIYLWMQEESRRVEEVAAREAARVAQLQQTNNDLRWLCQQQQQARAQGQARVQQQANNRPPSPAESTGSSPWPPQQQLQHHQQQQQQQARRPS